MRYYTSIGDGIKVVWRMDLKGNVAIWSNAIKMWCEAATRKETISEGKLHKRIYYKQARKLAPKAFK